VNLILIGAQGCGKGTQAQRLEDRFQLKSCASGELLREAAARGTALGKAAQPYMDRGELVPDHLIVAMIQEHIEEQQGARGIILDGFPRTVAQAQALDQQMAAGDQWINRVIYLEVPRERLVARLSGRYVCRAAEHVWNVQTNPPQTAGICDFDGSQLFPREDDTADKIVRRLAIFFSETIQVTDYYAAQNKLVTVDGEGPIDVITERIARALGVPQSPQAALESENLLQS
jgi:adenylate kinase